MFSPTISSSETPSRYLIERAQRVAVGRDQHALAGLHLRGDHLFPEGTTRATVSFRHSVSGSSDGASDA
jgi:hypothetical protein